MGAIVLGVVGGLLALIAAAAALIGGGADTVIIGGWITAVSAAVGMAGGFLAAGRPRLGGLLMALAAVAAGLVAPGVIPAIADRTLLFIGYLTGGALLLLGAVAAFISRKETRWHASS